MPGPAAPPELRVRARESGSKVARRVLDQPLRRIGVVGAILLLAATAAFGGLEEQTQDGPEVLALGTPVEVAPFELTVHRVVWTTDLPGQHLSDQGNRWIGVVATVRSTSDAGVLGTTLQDALTLTDVEGLVTTPGTLEPTATVAVLEDGSSLHPVQPGLTYEVAFLYEHDGSVVPPTRATVSLQRQTWGVGTLDPTPTWRDAVTAVRGEVDVREAVAGEAEAEEGDA
ncbi:hypothetical protein [Cellulomonas xiejunii]|uniref:DUF4352 domain-containing protein n=1 Tax=Cellulomonas xiejunii TaxID=2968083 RepID=A0ABY5KT90_9CELL|nr:hypothetical protein [Cellulomonas xiejunii]MCC2321624.1 hypothetical protein [Cellulomonas xiejunii]UUI72939.1 hypothetical protein NP048_05720 [Cellulomonas xiejunii]